MWGFGSRAWRGEPERLGSPCGQEGVRKILLGALRVCVYALAGLQTALRVCVYALAGLQYTDAVFVPLACTVCLLTAAGTRIG